MATQGKQKWGLTPPLSTALPTEAEIQSKNALVEELKRQNQYESEVDTQKRFEVLKSLQKIVQEFVKQVTKSQKEVPDHLLDSVGGKIETYGGWRIGIYGPGSDIDTLVLAPKNVKRADFFEQFPDILRKMAGKDAITELQCRPDAHVPIIPFKYNGISIDLNFCRVALPSVPEDLDVLNDNVLRGMDATDAKAINGTRVADELMKLVPQIAVFRTALKGIKLWAKKRAMYANIVGFPGGIAWAILVARVCQLYPKATSSVIILKFFRIMEQWQWPMPVQLNAVDSGTLGFEIWNPTKNKTHQYHIMPVITPAYPAMCSTHNICRSTMSIIKKELKRGGDIMVRIMSNQAPWKDLFVKHTFFTADFKYYLAVISASTDKEAQESWAGLVQSRLRRLVMSLESHASISLARPFTDAFERGHECRSDAEIEKVKTGSLDYQIKETATVELTHDPNAVANGQDSIDVADKVVEDEKVTKIWTTTCYIGLEMREGAKSLDLSFQVDFFKKLCLGTDTYKPEVNALNVTTNRNFDLPDDLFSPDEVKPTRPVKKKAANGTSSKKRSATDEPTHPAKRPSLAAAVQ